MDQTILEVVVIGAGHAGLSASYFLQQLGMKHLVLERGRIGETWRSQRWDSFMLNTANNISQLPGMHVPEMDPHGFSAAKDFVYSLEQYVKKYQLPVAERSEVISVEKSLNRKYFTITVAENGSIKKHLSKQVIVCSGAQHKKSVPAFAKNISSDILQLHTSEYRNARELPPGAVLVVGSAQSGCQVADDLAANGKKTFLSTSRVGRVPGTYRGKDIMNWLKQTNFLEIGTEDVADPQMRHMRAPQLTVGLEGRRTISLQALAKRQVMILGRAKSADANNVFFEPDAAANVNFADSFSKNIREMIDGFIIKNQITAPEPQEDISDAEDINASCATEISSLHLQQEHITSIIWATGFSSDFKYIKLPVLDENGNPVHQRGMAAVQGLYFLGLPWLRKRKSGLIYGIAEDAEFICEKVYAHYLHEISFIRATIF